MSEPISSEPISSDPITSEPHASGRVQSAWIAAIRDVADFPKPGIVFKDIMPLLADAGHYAAAIDALAAPWREAGVTAVAAVEARGFILGAPLARALAAGFVPLRKPGKLPGQPLRQGYALEYGEDALELRADLLHAHDRVLLVDDVLATGGTLAAAQALLARTPATLVGAGVLIELAALGGRARWTADAPLLAAWTT